MFTILITEDKSYDELVLIKAYRDNINSKIIHLNIDNIDHLIIDCKDQTFLRNKLKLLNTSKNNENLNTYPNINNFFERNFLFGEEDIS